jgi:hypothetical protein
MRFIRLLLPLNFLKLIRPPMGMEIKAPINVAERDIKRVRAVISTTSGFKVKIRFIACKIPLKISFT